MTREQFKRWKDFAFRMAEHGLTTRSGRRLPAKSRAFVREILEWFFDVSLLNNWGDDIIGRIVSWDDTNNSGQPKDCYGREPIGPYLCDLAGELQEHFDPHYWQHATEADYARWDDLWGSRVRCCLRAGIDMACEPSAGVVGFTAGDLRRMYPEGVPEWITGIDWHVGTIMDTGERETRPFAEWPDDMPVLL